MLLNTYFDWGAFGNQLGESSFLHFLHLSPNSWDVWVSKPRRVNQVEVNVGNTKLIEGKSIRDLYFMQEPKNIYVFQAVLNGCRDI